MSLPLRQAVIALALIPAAVTACGVHARDKQQFAGSLLSQQADCPKMTSTLVIQEGKVVFSPGDGTWLLTGTASGSQVHATQSHPGADHKSYTTTLDAGVTDAKVTGTYTTPFCLYHADLTRF